MPKLKTPPGTVRVRCLGPIYPEHFFLSRDKVRNRICPRCEEKMRSVANMVKEPIFPLRD